MISQNIKDYILIHEANKIKLVAEYKDYLLNNGFSLSFDFTMLKDELKLKLFTQLLKADKSTAIRFEMLKDSVQKQKFIDDKINLTGYPEVDTLKSFITQIGEGIVGKNYELNFEYSISLPELLASDMDPFAAIDAQVISWTGETVYADMQAVASHLNEAMKAYQVVVDTPYDSVWHFLGELRDTILPLEFDSSGNIVVDEMSCYNYRLMVERERQFAKHEEERMAWVKADDIRKEKEREDRKFAVQKK